MLIRRLIFGGVFILGALILSSTGIADPEFLTVGNISAVTLRSGRSTTVIVPVVIHSPFHLQANPASMPTLIPTTLAMKSSEIIKVGKPIYPAGKPYHLTGSPVEVKTYQGAIEIRVPLKAKKSAQPGRVSLTGELKVQACNDQICFPRASYPVTVPVELVP